MAENETLDFGHRSRWRPSQRLLKDPTASIADVTRCAGDDFLRALRLLPAALRKGPTLMLLLRAAKDSPSALQEVIAAFKEKRLARLVLAAGQLTPNSDPTRVADTAANLLNDALIDQIMLRAKKERRFCSPEEQQILRASLTAEFHKHLAPLIETLECSMRGNAVKRIKSLRRPAPRLSPKEVARMSLVVAPPEQPHAR